MNRLGDALKSEREKRKISLEYIAAQTNININALTALENNRCEEIPGGFYFKNYLKSYLNAIDADVDAFFETHSEELAASYNKKTETSSSYCTKLKYSRFKKTNILLIILAGVALAAFLVYLGYNKKEEIIKGWNDWNKKQEQEQEQEQKQESAGTVIPQTGIDFMAYHVQDDFNRDYAPLNVVIEFTGRCWALVNRGKEKLIEKTFQAGEKLETGGYNLTLYLDNPAGSRFFLNGKEVTYLQKLTKPQKIMITPVTAGKLFE